MSVVNNIEIELSVVLGTSYMPIHKLLKLGRGAVLELDVTEDDNVMVVANEKEIATARVITQNGNLAVSIKDIISSSSNKRRIFY